MLIDSGITRRSQWSIYHLKPRFPCDDSSLGKMSCTFSHQNSRLLHKFWFSRKIRITLLAFMEWSSPGYYSNRHRWRIQDHYIVMNPKPRKSFKDLTSFLKKKEEKQEKSLMDFLYTAATTSHPAISILSNVLRETYHTRPILYGNNTKRANPFSFLKRWQISDKYNSWKNEMGEIYV